MNIFLKIKLIFMEHARYNVISCAAFDGTVFKK